MDITHNYQTHHKNAHKRPHSELSTHYKHRQTSIMNIHQLPCTTCGEIQERNRYYEKVTCFECRRKKANENSKVHYKTTKKAKKTKKKKPKETDREVLQRVFNRKI